jgi:hypothetical protein
MRLPLSGCQPRHRRSTRPLHAEPLGRKSKAEQHCCRLSITEAEATLAHSTGNLSRRPQPSRSCTSAVCPGRSTARTRVNIYVLAPRRTDALLRLEPAVLSCCLNDRSVAVLAYSVGCSCQQDLTLYRRKRGTRGVPAGRGHAEPAHGRCRARGGGQRSMGCSCCLSGWRGLQSPPTPVTRASTKEK